jgi:hypothetical protein
MIEWCFQSPHYVLHDVKLGSGVLLVFQAVRFFDSSLISSKSRLKCGCILHISREITPLGCDMSYGVVRSIHVHKQSRPLHSALPRLLPAHETHDPHLKA